MENATSLPREITQAVEHLNGAARCIAQAQAKFLEGRGLHGTAADRFGRAIKHALDAHGELSQAMDDHAEYDRLAALDRR